MRIEVLFMHNDKSLISFALISTTYNESQRDQLDMLVPFVLSYIKGLGTVKEGDNVSISDAKNYMSNEFGMDILSNVIEMIFKRLCKDDYGYLTRTNGCFQLTAKQIDTNDFEQRRQHIKLSQQIVLREFYDFLDKKEIEYSKSDAEEALILYLCSYGKQVIKEELPDFDTGDVWIYRVGDFVQNIFNSNKSVFDYIQDIAKGGMLSSVLFQKVEPNNRSKFENTEIYYDTPLLMYILGYSGTEMKNAVLEMTKLLQKNNATICYFSHNKYELEGILNAYITVYNRGRLSSSHNFDYFIANGIEPDKVIEYIALLDKNLLLLGLHEKQTPEDNYENAIDWKAFDAYLAEKMHYTKENRRKNDVDSLAAIYRLRKAKYYTNYENCEALFVATNSSLVYHSQQYFKNGEKQYGIPAIVDDTFLTALVWIKALDTSNELPTLKIISDALASQSVSASFWDSFVKKVEEYEAYNNITTDEAAALRFDIYTKRNVYDVTDGDIEKVTHENLKKILDRNDRQKHYELYEEIEAQKSINSENETKISTTTNKLIKEISSKHMNDKFALWKIIFYIGKHWLFLLSGILVIFVLFITWLSDLPVINGYSGISILTMFLTKLFDKYLSSKTTWITKRIYYCSLRLLDKKLLAVDLSERDSVRECLLKKYVY